MNSSTTPRIPPYIDPNQFANDLHKVGLLFDIFEDPREQFLIATSQPMFSDAECDLLQSIIEQMNDDDKEDYCQSALAILHQHYKEVQAQKPTFTADFDPEATLESPYAAALAVMSQPNNFEAAMALIRCNLSHNEFGFVQDFICAYEFEIETQESTDQH